MTGTLILESGTVAPRKTKGIWRVRLIEADVMGSSGYYSAEVLRRDGSTAFPAGTHVYLDHATESESFERPERSVKDLAGMLVENAHYEDGPDGKGLFARVQFFPDHKERVEAMAPVVGMSIRAAGTIEESESGRIVTSIVQGVSVDIVTHAGAGGRLIEMTEAAKAAAAPQVAQLGEADKAVMTQLQTGVTTLNTTMEKLVTFMEESKKQKEKAAEDSRLTAGQIVSKLAESGLPAPSQKRLADSYKDGDDLDKSIEDEKAYVASLTEGLTKKPGSGNTRSTGGGNPSGDGSQKPGTVETDDAKKEEDKDLAEAKDVFADFFITG